MLNLFVALALFALLVKLIWGRVRRRPPQCKKFIHASPELFVRYQKCVRRLTSARPGDVSAELLEECEKLGEELYSESQRLGFSKVYEGSPDIYWLVQCAAVISLLAFGRNSPNYAKYEADVLYYRRFLATAPSVMRFERYVRNYA